MNDFDINLLKEIMESDKFSDEEKIIVKARFDKSELADPIYDKIQKIVFYSDTFFDLLNEINKIMGDRCEHDRTFVSTCSACFDLEKKIAHLHPESFKNDPDCADLFDDESA